MEVYKTKSRRTAGTTYSEIKKITSFLFSSIKNKTKRRPYVRSAYFAKEKIFLDFFWSHIFEKENRNDRIRRMRYFGCAIELIENSRCLPISKQNPNKSVEMLHRFFGMTSEGEVFCVQIKENKKNKQKALISIFPIKKEYK